MKITQDGRVMGDHEHKVEMAIQRLKVFEPPDGYYVAFSGGKDSQCVYHLCKMAGVKFDAHYAMTSVDPPELIWFIRKHYPDVEFTRQHYDDGKPEHYYKDGRPKPITMWSLIADHTLPPTRKARYCCAALKEPGGGYLVWSSPACGGLRARTEETPTGLRTCRASQRRRGSWRTTRGPSTS